MLSHSNILLFIKSPQLTPTTELSLLLSPVNSAPFSFKIIQQGQLFILPCSSVMTELYCHLSRLYPWGGAWPCIGDSTMSGFVVQGYELSVSSSELLASSSETKVSCLVSTEFASSSRLASAGQRISHSHSMNNVAILPALAREKLAPNSNVEYARMTEDHAEHQM